MKTTFFLVKFFGKENHADDFVRGQIFANRLSEFKQAEDSDESGRMDRHEGTIAWLQPGTGRLTLNGMDMSDDLAGPIQIQKNWLNHLNVFCVHAAHSGDLDLASLSNDNAEALRQELTIPDECLSLGKYAVVVTNVPEFIKRMKDSARAKGYRIRWGLVKYYDPATFHGNFHDEEAAFWKQNHYNFQREFRFIMNSGSLGEEPLVMDIGDIRNITLQLESSELNGEKLLGGKLELQVRRRKPLSRQALRELKKIKLAWPESNYATAPGVLILHPSAPAIPPASEHPALVS